MEFDEICHLGHGGSNGDGCGDEDRRSAICVKRQLYANVVIYAVAHGSSSVEHRVQSFLSRFLVDRHFSEPVVITFSFAIELIPTDYDKQRVDFR
jgi:hypothetical protein